MKHKLYEISKSGKLWIAFEGTGKNRYKTNFAEPTLRKIYDKLDIANPNMKRVSNRLVGLNWIVLYEDD